MNFDSFDFAQGYNDGNTSFGGDGGGGFFSADSPSTGTPSGKNAGSDGRKGRSSQSLTPVTIRQLQSATSLHDDDNFRLFDGKDLGQVTVVAKVISISQGATSSDFTLEDGTGTIKARLWSEGGEGSTPEVTQWSEGVYVRATGQLRIFGKKRSLVLFRITPVEDFNEITHHLLQCVFVLLQHKNGGKPAGGANAMDTSVNGTTAVRGQGTTGLTSLQQQILNVFRGSDDKNGLSIQYVSSCFPSESAAQVREAIQYLSGEGRIYSTCDDEHFKSSE